MEKRTLGKTGMNVTVLGFGGAEIGYEQASQENVTRLLGSALDAGLNVIDTAECYLESEEMIGRAIANRRKDFYLFTKCGHSAGLDGADWDSAMLEKSIDRSLKRLRTDRVDLVQLHSCSEEILRQGDVIGVLQRARDAGKTRFIGYSGDGSAAVYAIQSGAFDTLQISISVADQEGIDLALPLAIKRNLGVIAKRPIANAVWKNRTRPENAYYHAYWERLQQLQYDFLKGDLQKSIEIAIRFTVGLEGVHTAIVGTTKPDRWRENAKVMEAGPLPQPLFEAIRACWKAAAGPDWVGQN